MMILKPKSIIIWKILSRKTPKNKFSQYFKLIRRNLLKFKTIRSLFKEKVKIMTSFKNKMIMIQDNHDKNKTWKTFLKNGHKIMMRKAKNLE